MALDLYMVGVVVTDMARSVEFYRRLGVDIPHGVEDAPHVKVAMGDLTFFLHADGLNRRWDPAKADPEGGYRVILEFYLGSEEAVDAKYAEMIGYGYASHFAPYVTPIGTYFAMVDDPDGNSILLSGGDAA